MSRLISRTCPTTLERSKVQSFFILLSFHFMSGETPVDQRIGWWIICRLYQIDDGRDWGLIRQRYELLSLAVLPKDVGGKSFASAGKLTGGRSEGKDSIEIRDGASEFVATALHYNDYRCCCCCYISRNSGCAVGCCCCHRCCAVLQRLALPGKSLAPLPVGWRLRKGSTS